MSTKLKKLSDQVVVITGASSGIGLATAEAAAKKGAKVVLAARSEGTLDEVVGRITAGGGHAVAVPTSPTGLRWTGSRRSRSRSSAGSTRG